MDILIVSIRTIFFYGFILIVFRLMGKREIGQLSILDLIVSILIAELVAISIENYDDTIWVTVIPILLLLALEITSSMLSLKFNRFRNIIEGKPCLIVNRGIINYKEMIKQRYTLDDLMFELRNNNIKDLSEVEYAVLENNGVLNIFKYDFLKTNSSNPFPLILDGCVQNDTLEYIEKNIGWLKNYLNERNIKIEDIFYAFYKNNKVYIIKRNEIMK